MYIHTKTLLQATEAEIRALHPNVAFPHPFVPPAGYAYIFPAPSGHNSETQIAIPALPEKTALGTWEQRWTVTDLPLEALAQRAAAQDAAHNATVIAQLDALDKKRIRPLAEGDYEQLSALNEQAIALRATLRK